jgi:hypothetical protein
VRRLAGIRQGLRAANVAKFDVIGFDACFMANWEVLVALQPLAELVLASEETEPGAGWDWGVFARALQSPEVSGSDAACALVLDPGPLRAPRCNFAKSAHVSGQLLTVAVQISTRELGVQIISGYTAQCDQLGKGPCTLALLDMEQVPAISQALNGIGAALLDASADPVPRARLAGDCTLDPLPSAHCV